MGKSPYDMDKCKGVVLAGLADGQSLRKISRDNGPNFPAPSTIILWASDDPAFAEQYAKARDTGCDASAEDIQDIADNLEIPSDHKRLMIDARKWLLSKRKARVYGDKVDIGIGQSKENGPVQIGFKIIDGD